LPVTQVICTRRRPTTPNYSPLTLASLSMQWTTPASYCYPQLIQTIQQPRPDYDAVVHAVHAAEALRETCSRRYAVQAEDQVAQAKAQLQQIMPAQQQHWQLVQELQAMQRACWNRSLSAELNRLILAKTSRYNVRMVAVSCPLLRDTTNAAEPIVFETSPWSRTRIAAGYAHTLCVNAGGRVSAWGANGYGQLGVGYGQLGVGYGRLRDTEERVVPTLVTRVMTNKSILQVTAGSGHSACLTADGLLFVCGKGALGQLGGGNREKRVVPTLVRGELEGRKVLQVAAGGFHTVCVTEDGSVFAFGGNANGQLGVADRLRESRLVPTLLRGLENKSIVHVAAGRLHTVFVTGDGLVLACGANESGQLGVGDTEDRLEATLVTGQLQGKTVVAGSAHTLCITADGSLFAWGYNDNGQLGVGDIDERRVPTLVTGQLQGKQVVHAAAASNHTICTTSDGSVFTWGAGEGGRLGLGDDVILSDDDNSSDDDSSNVPTQVRGELQNKVVLQVAAGFEYSACVTGDGSVYMWGNNGQGQLGVADVDCAYLPELVQSLDINAIR
jgi:alpha-tubulin suppressor-like RCC1 family protein